MQEAQDDLDQPRDHEGQQERLERAESGDLHRDHGHQGITRAADARPVSRSKVPPRFRPTIPASNPESIGAWEASDRPRQSGRETRNTTRPAEPSRQSVEEEPFVDAIGRPLRFFVSDRDEIQSRSVAAHSWADPRRPRRAEAFGMGAGTPAGTGADQGED